MIRNYNGNVNRAILRGLEKLCKVNSENKKILMDALTEKGEVSFYTNLDPFTGFPDEMSEVRTLKSEEQISEYLKEDFETRLTRYLKGKDTGDYLLSSLIEFVKENGGIFPNEEEMKNLEDAAEAKRVAELADNTTVTNANTRAGLLKEILELAEEIMELRRKSNPKEISSHVEPYPDVMHLYSEKFKATIKWDRWNFVKRQDSKAYSMEVEISENDEHLFISFYYEYDGTVVVCTKNWLKEAFMADPKFLKRHLIIIHQEIVEIAKEEGIEFETEIDYETISW